MSLLLADAVSDLPDPAVYDWLLESSILKLYQFEKSLDTLMPSYGTNYLGILYLYYNASLHYYLNFCVILVLHCRT